MNLQRNINNIALYNPYLTVREITQALAECIEVCKGLTVYNGITKKLKTYLSNLSIKDILYPVAPSSGGGIINECEALRGWAITLVFMFHLLRILYGFEATSNHPYWISFLLSGSMGVTLFFLLSGFLLSQPFIKRRKADIKVFFWNRFLRIMPLYTVFVVVGTIVNSNIQQGLRAICFWDLGLFTLWPFGGVWWSLGVEIQFYLFLPFIMCLIFSKKVPLPVKGSILPSLAVIAVVLYWKASFIDTNSTQSTNSFLNLNVNLAGKWPIFLLGTLLAYIQEEYGDAIKRFADRINKRCILGDFLLLTSCGAIVIFGVQLSYRYSALSVNVDFFHHHLIEGLLFFILMFVLINFKSNFKVIIVNPFFNVLGVLSYSIYLCHFPVLYYLGISPMSKKSLFTMLMLSGECVVLTIIISIFTYTFIEKIFLLFKTKRTVGTL